MDDKQQKSTEANTAPAGQSDAEENKVNGILAYIGILVLVPLLNAKESEFAQFHANQGLILIIAWFAVSVFSIIPIIGWIGGPIITIVLFVFTIMGIINAANGEMKELPIIGSYKLLK